MPLKRTYMGWRTLIEQKDLEDFDRDRNYNKTYGHRFLYSISNYVIRYYIIEGSKDGPKGGQTVPYPAA